MTKFSNWKNSVFGPFWALFPNFGEKFSQKIRLCHAQFHMSFQHQAKFQKKLKIQFQENAWTEGQMEGGKNF